MINVEFIFNGKNYRVESNINDKIKNIIQKLKLNINEKISPFIYLYRGEKINEELLLNEIISIDDKDSKEMKILVYSMNESFEKNQFSKIICPNCKEDAQIKIENYKIKIYGCINNHEEIIKLNEFIESQYIDKSNIICNIYKKNNENINFYRCTKCKINLCQKCMITHKHENDNINYIINYENKTYLCEYHNKEFIKYCKECRKNICTFCVNEHINKHNFISYENIIPDINILKEKINNLRKEINKIKEYIDGFISNLLKVKENLEIYFYIYNNIINNYNIHYINYEMLQNVNEINNIKKLKILKNLI